MFQGSCILSPLHQPRKGKFREEFYVEHFHVFSIELFKKLAYEAKLNCISIQDIIEPWKIYAIWIL